MRSIVCFASMLASVSTAALAKDLKSVENEPTIVVTASPLAGDPDRFATIVDVVGRDQILQNGGANLADALANVPGVAGTSFAAGASRPVIRGMDSQRVKVLEDGIGSFDVSEVGPDHGVPIDPLSAQKIEVVRGAATLRYGSQAIGGVVNAINNRVPLTLGETPLSGEVSGSYSSAAEASQGAFMLDGAAGKFAGHLDGFIRHTGDYDIPGGSQSNSFFRGDGFSGGGSYFFGDGDKSHAGLAVLHYDAKYGIPSDTTFIDMRQTKVLSKSSFAVDAGPLQSVNVDAGYASYLHDEKAPDGTVNSTFKNREWDGRAEALFGAMGMLSSSALGVQIQNRRYSALGEGGDFLFPTQTQSEAIFAFTEAPLGEKLNLQAAARVEHAEIKGTPASNLPASLDFTPVSGSIGVLFDVNDALKLGLTLSSAARAPGQVELFARGPHDGPGTYETGDPSLKIERSNSIEGTMRVRLDRFQLDGAVWMARFNNYVYGQLTGRTCDDDGVCAPDDLQELRELSYVQQDAQFAGAEVKAAYDLLASADGRLQANALADYVRARLSNGGGPVPRIQPYRIGGGLSWESQSLDAGFMVVYVGARDDTAAFETETKGYVDVQAQAAWRPLPANQGFEVSLVGRNLTDRTQRNAVALNKDDVVLPGRDIRFVVRQSF